MTVATRCDLLFESDRFNLSQPRDYFINDCCYGDDVARWLVERLLRRGIIASEPDQEDWGWYIDVTHAGASYFVGIGGAAEDEAAGNQGEWRLMIEKHRTLWEKLSGANPLAEHDPLLAVLREIIEAEPDMRLTGCE